MSSCTVRERIGWRTQSDQVADAIQSDSGRNPQGVQLSQLHQQSQQNNLFKLSPLGFAACQSKNCTNKTSGEEAPTECTEYTEPLAEKSLPQMARMRTDVGGYGIPAIPTLPNSVYSVNSVGEQRTLSICVNL